MSEPGKYAAEVGMAYGVSLILIAGLILFSLWRARRVRNALRALEQDERPGHG